MFTAKKVDIDIHHNITHTIQHTYTHLYKKGKDSMVCHFLVLFTFGFASQQSFDVLLLFVACFYSCCCCCLLQQEQQQQHATDSLKQLRRAAFSEQ